MHRLLTGIRPYLALSLLCLALYLPGIASVPPLDRDESRFAQASRQMLESGDFVRIRYQDTARNKKPVGIYWLQAAAVSAVGQAQDAAIGPYRLPSVLGALAAVLLTFHFGITLFDRRVAFIGAALLAGSLILVTEAHQAKTDAVLLACVVAAQGALGRLYLQRQGTPVGVPLLFWLAMGVGMLVKGPIVPLVSLLTILALGLADRRFGWLHGLRPMLGFPLAAAVVAPWLVAVSAATDGGFVGEAVKSDLLPKLLGAQESHGAWPGYYLLLATATLWPASLFLWPTLARSWRTRAEPGVRFCLAWIIPAWIVFEAVPTKLPHYTLPLYPALTLLIAAALLAVRDGTYDLLSGRVARGTYVFWALIGLIMAGGFVAAPVMYGSGITPWALLAAAAAAFAAIAALRRAWKRQFLPAAAMALGGAAVVYVTVFAFVLPGLDQLWLSRRVGEAVQRQAPASPRSPVASAGFHEPSLVFLLGTDTILTSGGSAASYIARHPGAIAVIARSDQAAFDATAAALGTAPSLLETVPGFNYSRGRKEELRLYRINPAPPAP